MGQWQIMDEVCFHHVYIGVSRSTHAESFTWSSDINPIAQREICECLEITECVRSLFLCETHAGSRRQTRKCAMGTWAIETGRPAFHPSKILRKYVEFSCASPVNVSRKRFSSEFEKQKFSQRFWERFWTDFL